VEIPDLGLLPLSPVIDKKNVGPVEGGRIWPVHGDTLYIGTKPAPVCFRNE
jgi:hypothetical protein